MYIVRTFKVFAYNVMSRKEEESRKSIAFLKKYHL